MSSVSKNPWLGWGPRHGGGRAATAPAPPSALPSSLLQGLPNPEPVWGQAGSRCPHLLTHCVRRTNPYSIVSSEEDGLHLVTMLGANGFATAVHTRAGAGIMVKKIRPVQHRSSPTWMRSQRHLADMFTTWTSAGATCCSSSRGPSSLLVAVRGHLLGHCGGPWGLLEPAEARGPHAYACAAGARLHGGLPLLH